MGARYAVTGNHAAVASSLATIVGIIGSASKRVRIYDWMVGADGTPADNAMLYTLQLQDATTAGTSTAVTPVALDAAEGGPDFTAAEDYTVEPTADDGIPAIELPINQRASYRWVAAPGGELILAATANIKYISEVSSPAYTGTAKATVHVEE
jgi:hypothetical protein